MNDPGTGPGTGPGSGAQAGRVRYRPYRPGPDPLAPPLDATRALRDLGREVFAGKRPHEALRSLVNEGTQGIPGLGSLARRVRELREEAARRGGLDGVLHRARAELDRAVDLELRALAADPSDEARIRESELASLPRDSAAALRHLLSEPYPWRSDEARQVVADLLADLRRETVEARLDGTRQARGEGPTQDPARVAAMADALGALLEAEARGERPDFDAFMAEHGDFFPEGPSDLDELADVLARRAAAVHGLAGSLDPEHRAELEGLMGVAGREAGLARALDRLAAALLRRRPDLLREVPGEVGGPRDLGLAEAVGLVEELAELAELEEALENAAGVGGAVGVGGASGAGALGGARGVGGARGAGGGADRAGLGGISGVDRDAVARLLGPEAAEAVDRLAAIEPRLREGGLLAGGPSRPLLTPEAVRRLGEAALRDLSHGHRARDGGGHGPVRDRAARPVFAGEQTGATVPWEPGTEAPLDAVATVRAAVTRRAAAPDSAPLSPDDLRAAETEDRAAAAVCLLVDLSSSMVRSGQFGPAREAALALYTLARSRYPQDAVRVVGFDESARELSPRALVEPAGPRVQGSNVQHALRSAREHFARHRGAAPVVVMVTDGEPTAHLRRDGTPEFAWPPRPETAQRTEAELDAVAAAKATMTLIVPGGGEAARSFAESVAARGGSVVRTDGAPLGTAVLDAYVHRRPR